MTAVNITESPVTEELLADNGLSLSDLHWSVEVANLKAFNLTDDPSTRISAAVSIPGGDCSKKELLGVTPPAGRKSVGPGRPVNSLGERATYKAKCALPWRSYPLYSGKGAFLRTH